MKLPDKKFILEDVKIRSFIKVNFSGKIVLGYKILLIHIGYIFKAIKTSFEIPKFDFKT